MSLPPESAPSGPAPIRPGASAGLSHVREGAGGPEAHMVDVSGKPPSVRVALARALVELAPGTGAGILARGGPKGPILEVARMAGILAAKRTGDLIPLCHPLGLDAVDVEIDQADEDRLEVRCRVRCEGRTGVEMEAMVGASIAALTIYDMVKGLDKGARISAVELLEKHGGKSGSWIRTRG